MKALVLYHLPIISQEFHAQLEILAALDIGHHHVVVGTVQQDLSQKLDALPLGDVRVRLHQRRVEHPEKPVEVRC